MKMRCVLQIHLKRKHWDGGAQQQQQGRASKRCTGIFQRQMQDASRQQGSGASRLEHSQGEAVKVPSPQKRKKWKQGGQAGGRAGSSLDAQAQKHAQVISIIEYCQSLPSPCCSSDSSSSTHQKRYIHRNTVRFCQACVAVLPGPFLMSLSKGFLLCPNGTPCRRRCKPRQLRHTEPARGLAQPARHPLKP